MQTASNDTKDSDIAEDFARFLAEFSYGAVNEQATEKLREVIAACKASGAKGSVTLKLSVAVKGEMASVAFKISASKPEPELPGRIYFATEEGALATSDPRQTKFPAKIIDTQHNVRVIKEG